MIKLFRAVIVGVIFIITTSSCEEDINPNADFIERNIFTCILRGDTNYQVANLSHSYEITGLDPFDNKVDPTIVNADVKMWHNNRVFQFEQGERERVDKSRYNTPARFYYNSDLTTIPGKVLEMEALLPNGILLKSKTIIPDINKLAFIESDKVIPPLSNQDLTIRWHGLNNLYYYPVLVIRYYDRSVGNSVLNEKVVPLKYRKIDGNLEPIFTFPNGSEGVIFDINAVRMAMEEISGDDPVKNNYSILRADLKLYVYDENLTAYFSVVGTYADGFTIKVDQSDFTNITGGFGVCGSYALKIYELHITEDYIKSFGYLPGF